MNKKGFSLVEMLLVLVLISIISLIVVPNINKMTSSNKEQEIDGYKKIILESLNMYVIDKKKSLNVGVNEISFNNLKAINSDINIENCSLKNDKIKITKTVKDVVLSDEYDYTFEFCLVCDGKEYCN